MRCLVSPSWWEDVIKIERDLVLVKRLISPLNTHVITFVLILSSIK